jgi:pimeloyl-ACP methyl ester carboxylesterase
MNWSASRETGSRKQSLLLSALRGTFALLGTVSPPLAAHLARRLFLTPPPRRRSKSRAELDCLRAGERRAIPGLPGLVARSWGQGPSVLLVHGWGGRSGQLHAFVPPLVEAGYRVVALDGPAHGDSTGARTDMMRFSDAIRALVEDVAAAPGGLHAVIAHSFGAACTLYALQSAPAVKLVLISCPPHAIWATERFGAVLRIPSSTLARMRELIAREHQHRFRWEELSLVTLAARCPSEVLVVHDEQDLLVPYEESAREILRAAPWLEHLATQGLGHRNLLAAPAVITRVCEFLRRPAAHQRPAAAGLLEATA